MGIRFGRTVMVLAFVSTLLLSAFHPVLASFPVLRWTRVDVPGDKDLLVVTPSEVTGVAAGRNGVVYVIDGENGRMYRSLNYGLAWEDITRRLHRAGATLPATMIAVAPDNEAIVAVITDGGTALYLSMDGGYGWQDTQLPALLNDEVVTALALSPVYTSRDLEYREIAVGTALWGDGDSNGRVLMLQGGRVWSCWRDQEIRVDPDHVGADVSALEYSPAYHRDHTLVVVAATGADVDDDYKDGTWLCIGQRSKDVGTTAWNDVASYPLKIIGAGDAVGLEQIRTSLALPSDFSGVISMTRNLFVGVDRIPDAFDVDDDVYRIESDAVERMNVDGGDDIAIWSIAYRGTRTAGVLLAGEREPVTPGALNVQVWRCEAPFAGTLLWKESVVPPTGPGHAVLAWAPGVSLAYCGTSSRPGVALDESAFSASIDGNHWRQMGLIDTQLTLTDLAVTPDGAKLFLTTSNEWGPESVWQSYSHPLGQQWERVLTVDSDTDAVIIKLSADYENDGTIYVAEHNGHQLAVSHNRGLTWEWCRESREPILDLVVIDAETLYAAIPDGRVMKSVNRGRSWHDPVDTHLDDINMLSRADDGTLFAGGRDGYVAYSEDDGESFLVIKEPVGTGDVQVLPDVGFEQNGWIYAAASGPDEGLRRWKVGVSMCWQQLDDDITRAGEGQRIGGLISGPEGTLYALRVEPVDGSVGGMTRWLCPSCEPCVDHEYDHVIAGLPAGASFEAAPVFVTGYPVGTLGGDDARNDIFAIDSEGQQILLYRDTLCKRGPFLDCPADGAHLDENPCACHRAAVVTFDWERLERVDEYEIGFYYDAAVANRLWSEFSDYAGIVISPRGDTTDFYSGVTYGWRVRTTAPLLSPWSEMWRFYPLLLEVTDLLPAPGATHVDTRPLFMWAGPGTAEAYEFVLATDPEFVNLVVSFTGASALDATWWACDVELAAEANYFWRVRSVSGEARSPWVGSAFTTAPAVEEAAPAPAGMVLVVPDPPAVVADYLVWTLFGLAVLLMSGLIVLVLSTAHR